VSVNDIDTFLEMIAIIGNEAMHRILALPNDRDRITIKVSEWAPSAGLPGSTRSLASSWIAVGADRSCVRSAEPIVPLSFLSAWAGH